MARNSNRLWNTYIIGVLALVAILVVVSAVVSLARDGNPVLVAAGLAFFALAIGLVYRKQIRR